MIKALRASAREEALSNLTGSWNDKNMTMSLPCREVLIRGQKDVEVIGPVKGGGKRRWRRVESGGGSISRRA
jgi:hypothetical protein